MTITTRAAVPGDFGFLSQVLLDAFNWQGELKATVESMKQSPDVWHYLVDWKRASDFGIIAEDRDGQRIGAAWARFLSVADPGYGFVAESIPEISMGVVISRRGRGVGRLVLDDLVQSAADLNLAGLSLSVEDGNERARSLYQRAGFVTVGRNGNSDTMLLSLDGSTIR